MPFVEHSDEEPSIQALAHSFFMIIASEIGDKTFLIAAILAMRHPRLVVFAGAFGSLVVMSALSAGMGWLLPALLPGSSSDPSKWSSRRWTTLAAAILFLVFGSKMFLEARAMEGGNEKIREEMKEAEEEINEDEAGPLGIPLQVIEQGQIPVPTRIRSSSSRSPSRSRPRSPTLPSLGPVRSFAKFAEGARNFCNLFLGPVFVQAFVLTFLGEWGDRSQIATIALGAAHNVYLVAIGTIIGHACCTALAVLGGRYVSSWISVKLVTLTGGVLFLLFGIIYLYESFQMSSTSTTVGEMEGRVVHG